MIAIGMNRKIRTDLIRKGSAPLLSVLLVVVAALGFSQVSTALGATATTISLATSEADVAQGKAVTMTATVKAGTSPVTSGHVLLCNASAQYCEGPAILGQAQLMSSGTVAVPLMLSVGTHSMKAIYQGTTTYEAATSSALTVTVAGANSTSTTLAVSGSAGNYSLQATVASVGLESLTGNVSFSTTTGTESVLGTAALGAATGKSGFSPAGSVGTGNLPSVVAVGDFNGDGIPDLAVVNSVSASLTILLGQGNGSYTATTQVLTTGAEPSAIAIGDFNNDGKQDFIVASQAANALYEFLGNGDGTFRAPTAPINESGTAPDGLVVGDFNRDGQQDLAVLNEESDNIVILLGNGQGAFTPGPQTLPTDALPYGIAIGDFNDDGSPDLATANYYGFDVTVWSSNGDGTFTQAATESAGVYPSAVATGDFNGDGKLDLAVTNSYSNTVSILLGNGSGGFTAASQSPATEKNPDSVAIADFNGDGISDLAVANASSGTVDVFLGNGNGAFGTYLSVPAGSAPYSVVAADWNGDGLADIAVADSGSSQVQPLLNMHGSMATATLTGVKPEGSGTQRVQASFEGTSMFGASKSNVVTGLTGTIITTTTTETVTPTKADVNEGVEIVGSVSPASVGALTPTGLLELFDGTAAIAKTPLINGVGIFNESYAATGTHSFSVVYAGDQNFTSSQSGAIALTVATPLASTTTMTASAVSVAHGTPVTLTATVTSAGAPVTSGQVRFCKLTLFCEDGEVLGSVQLNASGQARLTIALPVGVNQVRAIFVGTAATTDSFSATTAITVTGTYPMIVALSNTTADLAAAGGIYSLNANLTNGSWQPLPAESLNVVDTTNKNLVLASVPMTASVPGMIAKGTSTLASGTPYIALTADFNGDGKMDIAVTSAPSNYVSVLTVMLGNGDGTYTQKTSAFNLGLVYAMAVGDFNGDGKPDLAVANYVGNTVTVLLGNGDGTFTDKETINTVSFPFQIAAGDFNNDGKQDLVVSGDSGSGLTVLMGKGDGTFTAQPELQTGGYYMSSIAVADFNGDGFADLAVADPTNGALVAYGNGDGTFKTPQPLMASGTDGYQLAVADFNGDGRTDLAVYLYNSATVAILLNTSTNEVGSFAQQTSSTPIKASAYVANMVVADVNGDGAPDLITSDYLNSGSAYVDINQGNGNFTQLQVPVTSQGYLGYVVVGDFDLDGGPDLAIMDYPAGTVATYLNRSTNAVQYPTLIVPGSGTHVLEATAAAGGVYTAATSNPLSLAAAPISAIVELAVTPQPVINVGQTVEVTITVPTEENFVPTGTVSLYNGTTLVKTAALTNGVLTVPTSFASTGNYTLTAKYNGDPNLASASAEITIDVTTPSTTTLAASATTAVQGKPITLTASVASTAPGNAAATSGVVEFCNAAQASCTGSSLLGTAQIAGKGVASFNVVLPIGSYQLTATYQGNTLLQVSTSSKLALTVTGANPTSTTLTSTNTSAVGTYNLTATVSGKGPQALAGSVSLVDTTSSTNLGTASLGASKTTVAFAATSLGTLGQESTGVAVGDFNGDGNPDAAIVNVNSVQILLGNGTGGFTLPTPTTFPTEVTTAVAGDFNGDGKLDLAISSGGLYHSLYILLGNGNGTFTAGKTIPVGTGTMIVGDVNHDGNLDIIATNINSGNGAAILLGDGTGNFTVNPLMSGTLTGANFAALGDFNGDGNPDLAFTNGTSTVFVYLGDGQGGFSPAAANPNVGGVVGFLTSADYNKDGRLDIAVANIASNEVMVLNGNGDGSFTNGATIPTIATPVGMTQADFNQDGNLDLVLFSGTASTSYQILSGTGTGTFTAQTLTLPVGIGEKNPAIADFNKDGLPDLILPYQQAGAGTAELLLNGTTTTATATLSNTHVSGSGNQSVVAKYAGAAPYAASTSNTLTLAP